MAYLIDLANDAPKLSKRDLDIINRSHDQKLDRSVLGKAGLKGMEKMEDWGMP